MTGMVQADNIGALQSLLALALRDASSPWRAPAALGLAFERVIVRPVYGQHLKQILVTMGRAHHHRAR